MANFSPPEAVEGFVCSDEFYGQYGSGGEKLVKCYLYRGNFMGVFERA